MAETPYLEVAQTLRYLIAKAGFRPPFPAETAGVAWMITVKGGTDPEDYAESEQRIVQVEEAIKAHPSLSFIKIEESVKGTQRFYHVFARGKTHETTNPAVAAVQHSLTKIAETLGTQNLIECVNPTCRALMPVGTAVCVRCHMTQRSQTPGLNSASGSHTPAASGIASQAQNASVAVSVDAEIRALLEEKKSATPERARRIRARLRKLGYRISEH